MLPSGIFYSGKFLENHNEPLLILLNMRRKERLVANTLSHELCHLVGFLSNRYKADLKGENAANTMGFVMEDFCEKLTEYMKTIPMDPAPSNVELAGEKVDFQTAD